MSDQSELITCDLHGQTPTTFACQHIAAGVACGYHASTDNPNDQWPDAWCDLCDEAFQASGQQWTNTTEQAASIKALCTHCYEAAYCDGTTCIAQKSNGSTCTRSDECDSHYCGSGTCADLPVCF